MRAIFIFNLFLFASFLSIAQTANSNTSQKMGVTHSGLEYIIVADSIGETVKEGQLVVFNIKYNNGKDSLDTYTSGALVSLLADSTIKGGPEEGVFLLSTGDSAIFNVDNVGLYINTYHYSKLPEGIAAGSKTTFYIKVVDVMSKERVYQEKVEQAKKNIEDLISYHSIIKEEVLSYSKSQMKKDDKLIQNFIKKNKSNAQKTPSGIYYIIIKEGSGPIANPGDSATVNYVGKFLNGKEFDKSSPENPFQFHIGVGQVIYGFDEPLLYIKEGSRATIIIPSTLGYGKEGVKDSEGKKYIIPPDAILIFNIEVLKYSKME